MNRLQKVVVLLDTIEGLRTAGSRCGETHIQKAVYFLQTLFDIPLGYEFVMYKYGPFSFELSDELVRIRADGLLKSVPTPPFGTTFHLEEASQCLRNKFMHTREQFSKPIELLTTEIGNKGVKELEKLATALYIQSQNGKSPTPANVVARLTEIKPHISSEEGDEAVKNLEAMKKKFLAFG